MAWDRKIPFDGKIMMNYVYPPNSYYGEREKGKYEWHDADRVLEDTLTFTGEYSRGRSSSIMWMEDSFGYQYPMGHICFMKLVPKMVNGKVKIKFTFHKRGQNYLIDEVKE